MILPESHLKSLTAEVERLRAKAFSCQETEAAEFHKEANLIERLLELYITGQIAASVLNKKILLYSL